MKSILFLLVIITFLTANNRYNHFSDYKKGLNLLCSYKYQGIYVKESLLSNLEYRCNNYSRLDGILKVTTPNFITESIYKDGVEKCTQKISFNGYMPHSNKCKIYDSYKIITKNSDNNIVTKIKYAKGRKTVENLELYDIFKKNMLNIKFDIFGNVKEVINKAEYKIIHNFTYNIGKNRKKSLSKIEYDLYKNLLFTIYNIHNKPVVTIVYNSDKNILGVKLYQKLRINKQRNNLILATQNNF